MLATLKGRKSLLYMWEKQNRKCSLCDASIDKTLQWKVMEKSVDGKIQKLLVHDRCYKELLLSKENVD